MRQRDIVFFIYPGIKLLDLSGPLQVFSDANDFQVVVRNPYSMKVISLAGGKTETDTLLKVDSLPRSATRQSAIDTLVVVGGRGVTRAVADTRVVEAVAQMSKRSRRVAAVCSGAFLLAEAGLLDGRQVVTHWDSCALLAREYPNLTVREDKIFVRDGEVWTSAGVTAGIDLALAMVQADWDRATALSIARRLVTYMVRPGGQSQFSDLLELQTLAADSRFVSLVEWISTNLDEDLCVTALAERAHMSRRSFSRQFGDQLGLSPAKFVENLRVSAARKLLEESDQSVFSVAQACGFCNEERMRRSFMRALNSSPSEYRSRFVANNQPV
ncbi:MAG: DJ-1/PfpI family protein [Pseudomonadota bacterium]